MNHKQASLKSQVLRGPSLFFSYSACSYWSSFLFLMADLHPNPFPWLQHCIDANHVWICILHNPRSVFQTQHLHLERYFQCNMSKIHFIIFPHKPVPLFSVLSVLVIGVTIQLPVTKFSWFHLWNCLLHLFFHICWLYFYLTPHLLALRTTAVAQQFLPPVFQWFNASTPLLTEIAS